MNSFIPSFDLSPICPANVEFIIIVKLNPNCDIVDDVREAKVCSKHGFFSLISEYRLCRRENWPVHCFKNWQCHAWGPVNSAL